MCNHTDLLTTLAACYRVPTTLLFDWSSIVTKEFHFPICANKEASVNRQAASSMVKEGFLQTIWQIKTGYIIESYG